MGRTQENSSVKRKRLGSNSSSPALSDAERVLHELIRSKEDMGIWTRDMKRDTNLQDNVVTKSLKSLQAKKLIKEVVNIQNKGKKHYMAVEFEPSKELTGGAWYVEGNLDTDFIDFLKQQCLKYIQKMKIATVELVTDSLRKSGIFKVECSTQQIAEIMRALVLDNEIMEMKSNATRDFASIPYGMVCYRCRGASKTGAMATIPCGVCPRISECTPDGIISPRTCVYYKKWLDF